MPHPADDSELLGRYATSKDPAAFAELVRRYINMIYSAAARRVGDRALAEDITQAVLMVLARRPMAAARGRPLSAWLLTTVRYAAANALKMERRRRRHERLAASEGAAMNGICSSNPSEALVWREVIAELDDAVLRLPALDRRAVLLRFFEERPIQDVATALNVSEAAAKQRLSRSVEKLRRRLNRGAATIAAEGASGIAALLRSQAVRAAPARLCSSLGTSGIIGTGTGSTVSIAKGVTTMMIWSKVKALAAAIAIASVIGVGTVVSLNHARGQGTTVTVGAATNPGAGRGDKAAAVVVAAERLLEAVDQQMKFGNVPLTSSFVDLKGGAQRRLAEARIEAASGQAERLKAAQDLVAQCTEMLDWLNKRKTQDAGPVQLRQGEYYLAEAELLLAKVRAGE